MPCVFISFKTVSVLSFLRFPAFSWSNDVSYGLYEFGELFIPAKNAHCAKLKSFALLLK